MISKNPTWEEIIQHYKTSAFMSPMLKLVEHISGSSHRFRLSGDIFLDDLILSVRTDKDIFSDSLHISFDRDNNRFVYKNYHGDKGSVPVWEKVYEIDDAIKEFDQIILKTNWY